MANKHHRTIESRPRSWRAKLLFMYLKQVVRRKRRAIAMEPKRTNDANRVPLKTAHDLQVESFKLDDRQLHTLCPLKGPKRKKHVVFLHGGAYVEQATPFHWAFLKKLVEEIACRVTFVEYPLAPESHHNDTLEHTLLVTKKIREQFPQDELVLAGDSAGGGLAVATVQELLARQLVQPYLKLVLLSPWLDVTSLDRLSEQQKAKEVVMNVESLKLAAEKYAGPDSVAHHHISPLKGGFDSFPEVGVWMGGCEYFYPDLELFLQKLEAASVNSCAYVAEEMGHDYPLFPIPEAEWALNQIGHFIRG